MGKSYPAVMLLGRAGDFTDHPRFAPHNCLALMEEAKRANPEDPDAVYIQVLREANEKPFRKVLEHWGLDGEMSVASRKALFKLAIAKYGLGRVAVYRGRHNKNARTWTTDHDVHLLMEVKILRDAGLSVRQAVAQLAADRTKSKLFPYRLHRGGSRKTQQKRRAAALRARLRFLMALAKNGPFLNPAVDCQWTPMEGKLRTIAAMAPSPATVRRVQF